ncbi:YcxB family protein [Puniceicoccaceae bacterium K14]|nr:YcxB family protein [Puniceicoccaceae bacterium K14]
MTLIRYSLSEEDYLEFQMYSSILLPSHQKQRFRLLVLPCFLGVLLAFFAFIRSEQTMAACLLFYCGLWFVFNKKFTRWYFQLQFKKQITKMTNLGAEASIRIEQEGLHSDSLNYDGVMRFDTIESLTEIENLFLVKLESSNSIILPKNGIAEGDLDAFMQTLSQRTNRPITNDEGRSWK